MPQIRRHALHAATTYLVMQKAAIHVDGCNLLDTRGGDNCNNDGFFGAASSSIRKSLISTSDDAVKVCHDIRIENVTIGFDHQDAHALRLFYTVPLADKYNAMGMLGMHDLFEDR